MVHFVPSSSKEAERHSPEKLVRSPSARRRAQWLEVAATGSAFKPPTASLANPFEQSSRQSSTKPTDDSERAHGNGRSVADELGSAVVQMTHEITPENDKQCSPVPSNASLTSEQERAYHEAEQAAVLCEMKRMENCLAEERQRSALLQKTFAQELMAQKDAHARDIAALEEMVGKVLADNQRLSSMVEDLCGQVPLVAELSGSENSRRSTSASGSAQSSSSDDAAGSFNTHLAVCRRSRKDQQETNSNPRTTSSEAEQTTDSEPIPSSVSEVAQPAPVYMAAARRAQALRYIPID